MVDRRVQGKALVEARSRSVLGTTEVAVPQRVAKPSRL